MNITYLVIYVEDLEKSRIFYEAIGFDCVKEQHGSGPVHFSMTTSGIVIELYPKGKRDISRIRLGINVKKPLAEIGELLTKSISGSGENTLIANDPDGNTIEISGNE